MTLPATGLDESCRKQGLLPRERAAVRIFHGRRCTLATMACYASHLIRVVWDRRMRAVGLEAYIAEAGFLKANMASGAAIHGCKLRQPDLLNSALKVSPQGHRVAPAANQVQVTFLIVPPFAEVMLRRSDR